MLIYTTIILNHWKQLILNDYINKDLCKVVDNFNKKCDKHNKTRKDTDKYIQNFLSDNERQIYYINKTDIYVIYNNINFNVISEDEIWHMIFNEVSIDNKLNYNKIYIKDTILTKIKKNNLLKSLPESKTIQEIIKLLFILFNTKYEIKYFLTLLGDNILKKIKNLIHYCNPISKPFFDILQQYSEDYFKNTTILNSIRFKHHGCYSYKNIRILHINKQIQNYYGLPIFMKGNFFNLISVACYYSNRYENSELFIKNDAPPNIINKICYLENKTPDDIVCNFINKFIENTNSVEDIINKKDMGFLWDKYLHNMNLPNIIFKNNLQKILEEKLDFNENFRKIKSKLLIHITFIKQFWKSTIQMGELIDDDLEISEFIKLFNGWCKNNKKQVPNITDDCQVKEILEYYYPEISIIDDKYILNIKCNLWFKKDDIDNFINIIKNDNLLKEDISFVDFYKFYCKYSKKEKKIVVSKKYFEKYINKIIPTKYLDKNMILNTYWSSV